MAALARFDPPAERVEAFGGDEFLRRHSPHDFRSVTVFFRVRLNLYRVVLDPTRGQ